MARSAPGGRPASTTRVAGGNARKSTSTAQRQQTKSAGNRRNFHNPGQATGSDINTTSGKADN